MIQVARVLQRAAQRPGDLVARYGGEEFVIIAAHCDAEGAFALADILRLKVEELRLPHAASSAGVVTVSAGVASLVPDVGDLATQLIQMADAALYRAKEAGRNRVEAGSS